MANRFKVVHGGPYPHFVTASVVRWLPVFVAGPYFKIVLRSLDHLRAERGLLVHAYVIMPTHLHAILTASKDDLSAVVRDFKRFTAGAIYGEAKAEGNRVLVRTFERAAEGIVGSKTHVWQHEFHPEAVYSREFFAQKADYLHANPVRKGLVADAVKWYYSSAAAFAGQEAGPIEVDWLEW